MYSTLDLNISSKRDVRCIGQGTPFFIFWLGFSHAHSIWHNSAWCLSFPINAKKKIPIKSIYNLLLFPCVWGRILLGIVDNLVVTNLISQYKYQFSCTTLWFFFLHGIRETIKAAIFPSLAGMSLSFFYSVERVGPCWLLKLRWMGTQGVHMKGVLPRLVRWACRARTRDFCPALAALVGPVQNIFFLTVHYFYSYVPIA